MKKKKLKLSISILLIFFSILILCPAIAWGGKYECSQIRVVDGDTLDCGILDLGLGVALVNERIRLVGINSPESFRPSCPEERAKGILAKEALAKAVADGIVVVLTSDKDERGKFGRVFGWLYVDGENINDSLIEDGHAIRYDGGKRKNVWCQSEAG